MKKNGLQLDNSNKGNENTCQLSKPGHRKKDYQRIPYNMPSCINSVKERI